MTSDILGKLIRHYDEIPDIDVMYEGYFFVVPYAIPGKYVAYAFSYTGGALMQWCVENLAKKEMEDAKERGISVKELLEKEYLEKRHKNADDARNRGRSALRSLDADESGHSEPADCGIKDGGCRNSGKRDADRGSHRCVQGFGRCGRAHGGENGDVSAAT